MTSKAFELARLGNAYSDGALSNRNLIINGAMQVAQRGTSSTAISSAGYRTVDRFSIKENASSIALTETQSTDAPDGFPNSLKWEVTTADTSVASAERVHFGQTIEAQNLQQLAYNTSSAKTVMLSFWVKSSITGTYAVTIFKPDQTLRLVNKTYAVVSADTWEKKTITIVGDTSGGGIDNNNGSGFQIDWFLIAGSGSTTASTNEWEAWDAAKWAGGHNVNFGSAVGNEFYITGIQLEVGDTATPFEHRSFGDELARCQRYYWNSYEDVADVGGSGADGALYAVCGPVTNDRYFTEIQFPTQMRAQPTLTYYGGRDGVADTAARVCVYNGNTLRSFTTSPINSRKGFSGYFDTGYNDNAVRFQVIADAEL